MLPRRYIGPVDGAETRHLAVASPVRPADTVTAAENYCLAVIGLRQQRNLSLFAGGATHVVPRHYPPTANVGGAATGNMSEPGGPLR